MRDFPSCFGENGVQVVAPSPSSTSKIAQGLVSCVYRCKSRGGLCFITVTWTKHLMGHGLAVGIDDICKVDIKPWLFSRKKGSRNLEAQSRKICIFWDLTGAIFGSGPEPIGGFHLAVVFDQEMVLLLGDSEKEAYRKMDSDPAHSGAVFVARREHIFGKKLYGAKARFCEMGRTHDLSIECDTAGLSDPCLVIRVDSKPVMQIKRLKWKFRGNYTIMVDGIPVQVFWDVHNWFFGDPMSNAVFMFQTCVSAARKFGAADEHLLAWSCSQGLGFSLILYAWKND